MKRVLLLAALAALVVPAMASAAPGFYIKRVAPDGTVTNYGVRGARAKPFTDRASAEASVPSLRSVYPASSFTVEAYSGQVLTPWGAPQPAN